ncbi:MAG: DoxX family protein [Maricaulaceae bacterium]|nr:DoxX family protein [Maricaulaceae bacterium]
MNKFLFLNGLARHGDLSLLALRLLTGAFLMWETQDNILSAERMAEFERFLGHHGFMAPELMAPLSVYAQFICGALFALGLLIRWAGWVMVFNFVVAIAMVHWGQDFRGWWPAIVLVFISLHFAVQGGGRWSLERALANP